MRRQNKKWVGWGNFFRSVLDGPSRVEPAHSSPVLTKTDPCASRKVESVPDGHRSGADGVGAGTLSTGGTPYESDAGGVGAGTLSTDGTPHNLTQFFFHAEAANSRIQFYNFSSETQSPPGPRRQQIIFRKSFRNTLKVLKSPPATHPPQKKFRSPSPLDRTLCCKGWGLGVFDFSA